MKILTACLPEYFPSQHFYSKIINADVVVIADGLQYSKHSSVHRTKIRTAKGWQWLTVPVLSSGKGLQKINEVKILPESNWYRKHLQAIKSNYKYAAFFEHYFENYKTIFQKKWNLLFDLNFYAINIIKKQLKINKPFYTLSDLKIKREGTQRIIELVNHFNCDSYLLLKNELPFVDKIALNKAGIELLALTQSEKKYRQQFEPFTSGLSIIDLIFNMGNESITYLYRAAN